ncbi:TniQ family protein [Methylocystis sp. JAN1]|uniref:TniQ family protein n=1 Tax=Methylocystis sp. JAN1 TaxID=3397211 RepID=UPI003FA2F03E
MPRSRIPPPRKPFPVGAPHHADEPAYSLLVRTAYLNGARRMYTVFEKFGIRSGQTVWDIDPDLVARFCKADFVPGGVDAVRAASPRVDPKGVSILGEVFARDQFSVLNRRWCPACLQEDPYHRVWWDTPYVSACPDHGIRIVEDCGCRTPPRWRRSLPTSCVRGHDFRKSPREPAPQWEIALSRYVRDRLLGAPRPGDALLDSLPTIGDAISALDRLGEASLGERDGLMKLRRRIGRAAVAAEGYRIMAGFPQEFDALLDRLVAASGSRMPARQWGVEKAYGELHLWIRDIHQATAFGDALRDAMRRHALANVLIKTGHAVAGGAVFNIPGVDMTTAAEMAGVTFERFRRIATAVGLLPKSSLRGRPARLDPQAVTDFAARLKGHKTRQEIAGELGIAPHVAATLIEAGILPTIVPGKSDRENRLNIWLLPETAAYDLLTELTPGDAPAGAPGADFIPIPLAARNVRAPLATILRLVIDGVLAVRAVDADAVGLTRLLVSRSDVRIATRRAKVPGLTMTEAAKAIGLHPEAMPKLIDDGFIESRRIGRIRTVSREQVDAFKAAYATTAQLAGAFGLHEGRSLMGILADAGVRPVCARPRFRQVIYRRADAEAALAAYVAKAITKERAPSPPADGLDRRAAARRMGLDPMLVTQIVEAGLLPAHRLSRGFLIAPHDADAFMARHVTASELAARLGKGHATAARPILARAGVEPVCGPPAFVSALFPRKEAEAAILAFLKDACAKEADAPLDVAAYLTRDEAAHALGVDNLMLAQLRRAGFVDGVEHGHRIIYSRSSVARFKEAYVLGGELDAMAGETSGKGDGGRMTDLLIGLGVAPACARPQFSRYVFPRAEACEALAVHHERTAAEAAASAEAAETNARRRETLITLREAQRRLGISSNMGSSLVRAGLLVAEKRPRTILVSLDEVARFKAAYVTPNEVAAVIGKGSPFAATTLLAKLGVKPVGEPPLLDSRLYDKKVVEDAVAAWRRDPSAADGAARHSDDVLYAGDVARRLRTVDSMVPALIKAGLLRADTTDKATVIRVEDFEAFRREYAMANEFTDALGVRSPKGVTNAFARLGVAPVVTEPPLPRALFRRREVEGALVTRIETE